MNNVLRMTMKIWETQKTVTGSILTLLYCLRLQHCSLCLRLCSCLSLLLLCLGRNYVDDQQVIWSLASWRITIRRWSSITGSIRRRTKRIVRSNLIICTQKIRCWLLCRWVPRGWRRYRITGRRLCWRICGCLLQLMRGLIVSGIVHSYSWVGGYAVVGFVDVE